MAVTARRLGRRLAFGGFLFLLMAPTLFFFYWMISLSLKTDVDNLANPPVLIPHSLTLKNYAYVFQSSPLPRFAVNSIVVGVGSTALALLLGVPAGYGIARSRRYGLALLILVARITPALSYLIPWFLLFQQLGLVEHLPRAHRVAPDHRAAAGHLDHDGVLRGRAPGPRGRRAHRRLLALRELPAGGRCRSPGPASWCPGSSPSSSPGTT